MRRLLGVLILLAGLLVLIPVKEPADHAVD